MDFLLYTFSWMSFNILLALIPVFLSFAISKSRSSFITVLIFILWILFIPNTIYLLTDLIHIPRDFSKANGIQNLILIGMYKVLVITGILSYVLSIYPLERLASKITKKRIGVLIVLNALIGLGLILGRVYRFNSWDVITEPWEIASTVFQILLTVNYVLILVAFSILATWFYVYMTFKFRKVLRKFV